MKKNKTQQSNLNTLLTTSDYNEVKVYLKRNKYLANKNVANHFWESNIPIKWFSELVKEPFFDEILFSYFRSSVQPNKTFLKQFLNSKNKVALIKVIKLSEIFNCLLHWESFSVFKNDSQLNIFLGLPI